MLKKKYYIFTHGIYDRHNKIKPVLHSEYTSMFKMYANLLKILSSHHPSFKRFKEVLKDNDNYVVITKWEPGKRAQYITYTW